MIPKDFLKSKNIPSSSYNAIIIRDNEMNGHKIIDLLHEYGIELMKQANGIERESKKCHIQSVSNSVCPHPKAATVGIGTYVICENCGGIKMLAN